MESGRNQRPTSERIIEDVTCSLTHAIGAVVAARGVCVPDLVMRSGRRGRRLDGSKTGELKNKQRARVSRRFGALLRRLDCDWFRKLNEAYAFGCGWKRGSQVSGLPWATGERALRTKEAS